MGVLAKYVKAASERKRYQIIYSNWLDIGEAVASVTFAVQTVTVPPLVIDGVQVLADGSGVQYYAGGGLDGTNYVVTATMVTNMAMPNTQTKIDDILFSVREPV